MTPTGPMSAATTSPCCCVTRTLGPTIPLAAVAPSTTTSFGPNPGDLGVQPRAAGAGLVRRRGLVDAALAAWLPLEVLHHVRDVHLPAVDAGIGEGAVQERAGRPDERYPRQILLVPGLLADEHQLGAARPCAEYRLRRVTPQIAGPAAGGRGTQGAQGGAWRRGGYGLHEGHVGPDADTVPSVPSEV